MKKLKIIGLILGVLYALTCVSSYMLQERIIFDPYVLPEDYDFQIGQEVEIEVEKNIFLNTIWIKEPPSKGVILYLHGNRGSIRRCLRQTQGMRGNGYDIFMPDYRGYGKSDGKIVSEEKLHQDAQKVYDFLKQYYAENQIIIIGYSLGTGMATRLAANNAPQQLVLVAPYLSMVDLKNRWTPFLPDFLIKYPLRSNLWIPKIKTPITIFHGTKDEVIPYDSSEKIKVLNSALISLIPLEGVGHRGALFNDLFRRRLGEIIQAE